MLPFRPNHQLVGSIWFENLKNQRKSNCGGKERHFVAKCEIL